MIEGREEEYTVMKRVFGLAVLALPLLAASARAEGFSWFPYKVEAGANAYLRVQSADPSACGPGCNGPWYNYWPYEAHFHAPAVPCFPFYPNPQMLPPKAKDAIPVPPAENNKNNNGASTDGPSIKAAGYYRGVSTAPSGYVPAPIYGAPGQVPSYWFDR
jgi:hypothetical protein